MRDDDRPMTLADLADELCDPRQHVERIPYWDANRNRKYHTHKITLPGLLAQMADLMQPSSSPDGGSSPAGSRPPGRWDAIADHALITAEVTRWCWHLHLPIRNTVERNIRQLVGATMDGDTRAALERHMRRWHRIASYVTGWTTPPAHVRAPCPAWDDTRGRECRARTLRVSYADAAAYCSTCGTTWDRDTVGLLAETVRAYNATAAAEADLAKARARAARVAEETAA